MQGTYPRGGSMNDIFDQDHTIPVQNPTYPMANLKSSAYAAPLGFNRPTEALGGYDTQVNPMTGQEMPQTNFARGGLASLTQPSDDFTRAMHAGIAAYAGGGSVRHFDGGGATVGGRSTSGDTSLYGDDYGSWWIPEHDPNDPYWSQFDSPTGPTMDNWSRGYNSFVGLTGGHDTSDSGLIDYGDEGNTSQNLQGNRSDLSYGLPSWESTFGSGAQGAGAGADSGDSGGDYGGSGGYDAGDSGTTYDPFKGKGAFSAYGVDYIPKSFDEYVQSMQQQKGMTDALKGWLDNIRAANDGKNIGFTDSAFKEATGVDLTPDLKRQLGLTGTGEYAPSNTSGTIKYTPGEGIDYGDEGNTSDNLTTKTNWFGNALNKAQNFVTGLPGALIGGMAGAATGVPGAATLGANAGGSFANWVADKLGIDPSYVSKHLGGTTVTQPGTAGSYQYVPSPNDMDMVTVLAQQQGLSGQSIQDLLNQIGSINFNVEGDEGDAVNNASPAGTTTTTTPTTETSKGTQPKAGDLKTVTVTGKQVGVTDPNKINQLLSGIETVEPDPERPGELKTVTVTGQRPGTKQTGTDTITTTPIDTTTGTSSGGGAGANTTTTTKTDTTTKGNEFLKNPVIDTSVLGSGAPSGGGSSKTTSTWGGIPLAGAFRSAYDPMYSASTSAQYGGSDAQNLQDYMANLNQSLRPGPITPYTFQTAPERVATPQGIASVQSAPPQGQGQTMATTTAPPQGQGQTTAQPLGTLASLLASYQTPQNTTQPQGIASAAAAPTQFQPQTVAPMVRPQGVASVAPAPAPAPVQPQGIASGSSTPLGGILAPKEPPRGIIADPGMPDDTGARLSMTTAGFNTPEELDKYLADQRAQMEANNAAQAERTRLYNEQVLANMTPEERADFDQKQAATRRDFGNDNPGGSGGGRNYQYQIPTMGDEYSPDMPREIPRMGDGSYPDLPSMGRQPFPGYYQPDEGGEFPPIQTLPMPDEERKYQYQPPSIGRGYESGPYEPITDEAYYGGRKQFGSQPDIYEAFAHGGIAHGGIGSLPGTYKAGGKLLRGPGDGMSDSIPAVIHGKKTQRAALADGEFVIPADVVSHLGNGSTDAGARKLYAMMDKIRQARTGRTRQAPQVSVDRYMPKA